MRMGTVRRHGSCCAATDDGAIMRRNDKRRWNDAQRDEYQELAGLIGKLGPQD